MLISSAEYQRNWRATHPGYQAKYNAAARKKYGAEYFRQAAKKSREKNPEATRLQWRKDRALRRARIKSARVEKHIRIKWLHNWDSKICGICGQLIEGEYQIDHIIPLSRNGEHSVANLQLAHPFCNKSKNNRLQEELSMLYSNHKETPVPS